MKLKDLMLTDRERIDLILKWTKEATSSKSSKQPDAVDLVAKTVEYYLNKLRERGDIYIWLKSEPTKDMIPFSELEVE